MIGKTTIVVDSAAYLPAEVRERFGVVTVPLTVVVDGQEFLEFEDLGAKEFYTRLAAGAKVSTSQPSPGRLLAAYQAAQTAGAERVLSMHIGSGISGTVDSARMAASMAPIPVRVVDTGQASFIEGLCAWEAIETLAAGGSEDEAEAAALRASAAVGNVFIVRGLELLAKGGRLATEGGEEGAGVPVLALVDRAIRPIGMANSVDEAMDAIIEHLQRAIEAHPGKEFRVGIANGAADELAGELESRVRRLPVMAEVMQYVIGPVVGAHTGAGCTGAVFLPRPV